MEIDEVNNYDYVSFEKQKFKFTQTFSNANREDFCGDDSIGDSLGFFYESFEHSSSMIRLRFRTDLFEGITASYQNSMRFGIKDLIFRTGLCPKECKRCESSTRCLECHIPYKL